MPRITFEYTNWRGETAVRTADLESLRIGSTEWHPNAQWLLLAVDAERGVEREFAVSDMRGIDGEGLLGAAVARLPVTTPGAEGWADLVVVDGQYAVMPAA